ncbi:MAG TPA: cell envelope integrity protein TolA [Steroidobacteraceae bacterium]|jgi:colicin import membrane protein
MSERGRDRTLSIVLSILIHAAIVGALVWGWWQYRRPTATPPSLAIDATVVNNQPAATPPPPSPPPPQPVTQPPPPDQQAEQEREAQQKRAAQEQVEKAAAEKAAADKAAADKAATEKAAAEKAVADKAAAERAAAAKAEAEKAAAAAAAVKAKAEADRKAQELALQKKAEQERAQREADLRSQLANEEHVNAVQSSPAKAEYLALITARINRAWIRPPSARAGVKCSLHITQIPGGEITNVVVTGCNGDESVRQSVETAAYRASPLPAPPDPALFDPNIDVTFAPDE